MLVIFYGTSAELIKMLGIVKRVPRAEQLLICTAQHREGLKKVHKQLGIRPDIYLSNGWHGHDVANMKQMVGMMLQTHARFIMEYRMIRRLIKAVDIRYGTKSIGVVHGDTLSTVVGAYLSILLGMPVAHVEAGLRSGTWKNPFPEEIDRRVVARIARVHFPPNPTAESNLTKERVKGVVVNTTYNTAKDAIEMSDQYISRNVESLRLPSSYCLVLLHRTELLEQKNDLEAILKVINAHASPETPVVFTQHTTTQEKINQYGFGHYLHKEGLQVITKQPYFDFMAIVKQAAYIVTDGGGLQEDAFFLGIPVMVHRERTERDEGLGLNADISHMDVKKVEVFLRDHKDKKDFQKSLSEASPSGVVVNYFRQNRYISG